jgi:2'-5' RNA ligase
MRVFSALFPPDEVVEDLSRAMTPWRRRFPDLDWTPPQLWHMRLSYFGNASHADVSRLSRVLEVFAREHSPFEVRIDGAGAIPELTGGQTLYAKLETPDDALLDLCLGAIAAVQNFGWVLDRRSFTPTFPLARSAQPVDFTELAQLVSEYQSRIWEVTSFATVWARPGSDGHQLFELLGEHALLGQTPAPAGPRHRADPTATPLRATEPRHAAAAFLPGR